MMQSEVKFRVLEKKVHMTQFCEEPFSTFLFQQEVAIKFDQMEKMDGDKSHRYAETILVLESSQKPNRWKLFQQAQLSDRLLRFTLCKLSTNMEWKYRLHQFVDVET